MGKGVTLVNRHCVRHAVARVHDDASSTSRSVEGKHSLDGHVHGRDIERFEHDLRHTLTIGLWIQGRLGKQNWMLLWGNAEFIVKCVVPDLLHIVPIGHDAVLDRVLERQHTALALGLVTDITVLLVHPDHNSRHLRPANDGWEDCSRRIVACKASLAHARAVVYDERCHLVLVGHAVETNRTWPSAFERELWLG